MTDLNTEFVSIRIFTLPTDLLIAKARLESEGIETRTLDELTIQTDNFLSNAIGGVKLQVRELDYEKADQILEDGGFSAGKPAELTSVEKKIAKPHVQKQLSAVFILFLIFLVIVVGLVFVYTA